MAEYIKTQLLPFRMSLVWPRAEDKKTHAEKSQCREAFASGSQGRALWLARQGVHLRCDEHGEAEKHETDNKRPTFKALKVE